MAEFVTIRIRARTHERLKKLVARAAKDGWQSIFKIPVEGAPSMASLLDRLVSDLETAVDKDERY